MDYYEGLIKNTEFFTTAELAEKLKMNVQVITRKVQSGEIKAYKIGKDWRIPEASVFEWLEKNSNTQTTIKSKNKTVLKKTTVKKEDVTSKNSDNEFFQPVGNKRKHLLEYILAQFVPNREYTEEEVDAIINRYESDSSSVRQDFLNKRMLEFKNGYYYRSTVYQLLND